MGDVCSHEHPLHLRIKWGAQELVASSACPGGGRGHPARVSPGKHKDASSSSSPGPWESAQHPAAPIPAALPSGMLGKAELSSPGLQLPPAPPTWRLASKLRRGRDFPWIPIKRFRNSVIKGLQKISIFKKEKKYPGKLQPGPQSAEYLHSSKSEGGSATRSPGTSLCDLQHITCQLLPGRLIREPHGRFISQNGLANIL